MELLKWREVNRKRNKNIRYTDEDYVVGYDLDQMDFAELVAKFNAKTLSYIEECRLALHVRTMLNIVLENPKIQPRPDEIDGLTDAMFLAMWNSLKYIKEGRKPYSYMYQSGSNAAHRYYKTLIHAREKEEAIMQHLHRVYDEWQEEQSDGKVDTHFNESLCYI